MTNKKEIYKCEICGNIIEIIHNGKGEISCCGKPMVLKKENSIDASTEKHVPKIEGKKVIVGFTPHPMDENHSIEWIEATGEGDKIERIHLHPSEKPEAIFDFNPLSARAYCNLHGLWKSNQ
ncbi:desulfoferrodoxin [Candidatus Pacearchaeota archaeon ex4484_71]|nr:MAG: desulfoferrodoxin [Candidatus Pacearchaeota archaeon ex4484_71]